MRNTPMLALFAANDVEHITTAHLCVAFARIQAMLINLHYEQEAEWNRIAHETRARFAMARDYPITAERHRAQARRLLGGAA